MASCSTLRSSRCGATITSAFRCRETLISVTRPLREASRAIAIRSSRRHLGHGDPVIAVEDVEDGVERLGRGAAVVAGHKSHQRFVLGRQAEQLAVHDEVHRVLVQAVVADKAPDLVQQRGEVEEDLEPRVEPVLRPRRSNSWRLSSATCRAWSSSKLYFRPSSIAERITWARNSSVHRPPAAISRRMPSRRFASAHVDLLDVEEPRAGRDRPGAAGPAVSASANESL